MTRKIDSMASNGDDLNGVSAPAFVCVSPFFDEHTEFFTAANARGGDANLGTLKTGSLAIPSAFDGNRGRLKRRRAPGNYSRVAHYGTCEIKDVHQHDDEGRGVSLRRRRRMAREEVRSMGHGEVSPSVGGGKRTALAVDDPPSSTRRKVCCIVSQNSRLRTSISSDAVVNAVTRGASTNWILECKALTTNIHKY